MVLFTEQNHQIGENHLAPNCFIQHEPQWLCNPKNTMGQNMPRRHRQFPGILSYLTRDNNQYENNSWKDYDHQMITMLLYHHSQ